MASKCIDNCVNIESDVHSLQKVTIYTNLHKWPMAEVEFVKSISHGNSQHRTLVMNNITCRQMYLRSYTFTRKENEEEGGRGGGKTGDQLNRGEKKKSAETTKRGRRKKSKATPCRAFVLSLVWKCFSCTSSTKSLFMYELEKEIVVQDMAVVKKEMIQCNRNNTAGR
ncbi:hypothetical protein YC2023_041622 [Brassica napus]